MTEPHQYENWREGKYQQEGLIGTEPYGWKNIGW